VGVNTTATITNNNFVENATDAAIYNVGTLGLLKNTVQGIIFSHAKYGGQIITDTYIVVLDNTTQEVAIGEEFTLYAKIVDDNNNTIVGLGDLAFVIAGEDNINATFNYDTLIFEANYTPLTAQTRVVSAVYSAMDEFDPLFNVIKTGTLIGQKTNATFLVYADDIILGENATINVELTGLDYVGLDATVKVVVNDTEYLVNVVNGTGSVNISGLYYGSYPIFGIFDGLADYNSGYASNSFAVVGISKLQVSADAEFPYGTDAVINFLLLDGDDMPIQIAIIFADVNGQEYQLLTDADGKAVLTLSGLNVSSYTVQSWKDNDDIYASCEGNNVTFNVTKVVSSVKIDPIEVTLIYTDDVNITTTAVNGVPIIIVYKGTEFIANGTGYVALTNLSAGNYTVGAVIPETDTVAGSSDIMNFTVLQDNAMVILYPVTEEITYPGDVNITYDEFNGVAEIVVKDANNNTIPATVADGVISLTGLDAGIYFVTATIADTPDVIGDSDEMNFTVEQDYAIVLIEPVTEDVIYPGAVNITYVAYGGEANITVKDENGNDVPAVIENGVISLTDLDAGVYTVNITIAGTPNVVGASDEINFTVEQDYAIVEIDPVTEDVTYPGAVNITYFADGGNAVVTVKDANGNVVPAVVGDGVISLTGLDAGTYNVTVTIADTPNVVGDEDQITFTVEQDQAIVAIVPVTEDVIYPGAVNITYVAYGGNAVVTVKDENGNDVPAVVGDGVISLTGLDAGIYFVTAAIADTPNVIGDIDEINFTVEQDYAFVEIDPVTETITAPGDVNISYFEDGGVAVITVIDQNGTEVPFVAENGVISLTNLTAGSYAVIAVIPDTPNVVGDDDEISFYVSPGAAAISIDNPENSTDTVFSINLPEDATGTLYVDIDGQQYYADLVNGTASVSVPGLAPGNYTANIRYSGDDYYPEINETTTVSVPSNVNDTALTIPEDGKSDAPTTYSINLPSDATGYLEVDVDGKKYISPLNNGSASVTIPALSEGSHNVTVKYSGDSKYSQVTKQTTLNVTAPVFAITNNKNVATVYSANAYYKVLVTRDGKAVGAGEKVTINYNGKTYTVKTDSKGYASFKLVTKVKVKKYTITATYKDVKVTNKVTIKHVIKASNKKVKKSKKVNKVKVSLKKVNGKYLKGKVLKIKFNKKTYKVKTNKKGVATWKVKKSMLKKLKVGKKYKYTVTYGKDKLTKKLTIKK
jgi:hypothetical protein